jgi:hypothetical protein
VLIVTGCSELLSKTSVELEEDRKQLAATIQAVENFMGSATEDLLHKADKISRTLGLVSKMAECHADKLHKIYDKLDIVQGTVNMMQGFSLIQIRR